MNATLHFSHQCVQKCYGPYFSNYINIMEDERRERTSGIKLWIGIVIGLVIGYIIGINGYIRVEKDNKPSEETTIAQTAPVQEKPIPEKPTTIAKKENTTARSATKSKSKTKTATTTQTHTSTKKSAQSEQKYTQAVAKAKELSVPYSEPQKEEPQVGTDANAVVMTSYSHDWGQPNAQISVKNNTDKEITSITGRMIYYDMSGNMLDYQDFTKRIDIDAGMTKRFELRGYNYKESYAYYKNQTSSTHPHNKYKVEFQLKSYTYK